MNGRDVADEGAYCPRNRGRSHRCKSHRAWNDIGVEVTIIFLREIRRIAGLSIELPIDLGSEAHALGGGVHLFSHRRKLGRSVGIAVL